MAARHADLFTVSSASDIDEFERVLAGETDDPPGSITIDIPEGATTFFNARDFRRVLQAARASDTALQVRTDDPLRRELARIIGITIATADHVDQPREASPIATAGEPTTRTGPVSDDSPVDAAADTAASIQTPNNAVTSDQETTRASFQPWLGADDSMLIDPDGAGDEDEESEASFSFVITPPVPRRTHLVTEPVTVPSSTTTGRVEPGLRSRPSRNTREQARHDSRRRVRRRVLGLAVIVLTLLALAAVAFGLILPAATIAVTPRITPIEATMTYGLDTPGATWDIRLSSIPVSTTLTFSASGPTSGERFEPDATASGSVQLTNASTVDVVVAAGTVLMSESGIEVMTTEEIVVPAADPYGSLTFGSATVEIRAGVAGPDGNLAPDTIYGQLDNGIFYTNREPLSGGTSRKIAVVSPTDVDALEQQARDNLEGQATVALSSLLKPGQRLVEGSEQRGSMQVSFDRQVGEDATTIKIDATMTVSGEVFDPSEWHTDARREAEARLQSRIGVGQELIAGSVELSEPEGIPGAGDSAYTVRASARVRSEIDRDRLDALRPELAGGSPESAIARFRQIDGVDGVSIEQRNDWLTSSLPRMTSRITIEVVDAEGVSP